ncbi:MAG TPA: response regulator [Thermoplasmata archaeon]|jgi:two-component system, chemotaxis family, response regulator Rcp1|nr:response regulator [Thermoplasmata archaeon]
MPAPFASNPNPVQILMAEDNAADARLVREVMAESKILNELHVVPDGVEAMAYLRRQGKYAGAARPSLIFLDLNMPRKDGRQVLAEIKSDPDLKRIPVVVMTSSKAEEDIARAYDEHANCYVRKPIDFDQFHTVVKTISQFWFTAVELPPP